MPADFFNTNLSQTIVLGRHAQQEQNADKILRPGEEVRYQTLLVLGRRHRQRPHAGRLHGQGAVVGVVDGHEFGKVQRFVHKWSVDHEFRVVEACTQLTCDDVEVEAVVDRHGALIHGEEAVGWAAGHGVHVRKVVAFVVGPL